MQRAVKGEVGCRTHVWALVQISTVIATSLVEFSKPLFLFLSGNSLVVMCFFDGTQYAGFNDFVKRRRELISTNGKGSKPSVTISNRGSVVSSCRGSEFYLGATDDSRLLIAGWLAGGSGLLRPWWISGRWHWNGKRKKKKRKNLGIPTVFSMWSLAPYQGISAQLWQAHCVINVQWRWFLFMMFFI